MSDTLQLFESIVFAVGKGEMFDEFHKGVSWLKLSLKLLIDSLFIEKKY